MDEVLNTLNKEIKELETKKQNHILEKTKQEVATKKANKIREQLYKILNENNVFKEHIESDLEEFYDNLLSLFKRNYISNESFTNYEIKEFLDNEIKDSQNYLDSLLKARKGYIESLKDLKKQCEE